jgi:hypothetical protein
MTAPADGLPVWLIERGQPEGQAPTLWWRGKEQSGVPYMGLWTETAHEAVKFTSKETAEAFMASNYIRLCRATEHVFLNRADRLHARNFDLNREIVELRAKAQALQEQLAERTHKARLAGLEDERGDGFFEVHMRVKPIQEVTSVFPGIAEIPEAQVDVVVGRLLCSHMRDLLESEVFGGRPIRWREGRGWLERVFTICGPSAHVNQVAQRIQAWFDAMGPSPG